ncbi:hypothetical protein BKA66DRAFT_567932 [Pyrenochaeta sp. MPI-SDFR-AT-0127]|nr:hypothetical protein BKA66DRAFT_567932 [Pyrenochaeta sp. MPI-SDFR-AT-0127]
MASSTEQSFIDKINTYYENYPDSTEFIGKLDETPATTTLEQGVEGLQVKETDKTEAFRTDFLYIGGPEVILNSKKKKKVLREKIKEDASITDKVAKESSDSTASSHQIHDEDNQATSGGSVGAQAHKANPGPVQADNLPTPASKEELKKRAEELNK